MFFHIEPNSLGQVVFSFCLMCVCSLSRSNIYKIFLVRQSMNIFLPKWSFLLSSFQVPMSLGGMGGQLGGFTSAYDNSEAEITPFLTSVHPL